VLSRARSALPVKHLRVDGEWCFFGTPSRRSDYAVMILDGNGTTVTAESSNWERNGAYSAVSAACLAAGLMVAQSKPHAGSR
jgi:hypothetical protein